MIDVSSFVSHVVTLRAVTTAYNKENESIKADEMKDSFLSWPQESSPLNTIA